MCGIAGIIDYHSAGNTISAVTSMLEVIGYRGPDDSGIFHSPFATIGNVRLSIIDIKAGHQPLSDSSERYQIVFNGEIFNYRELRKGLEKKGVLFRTRSDTEVLLMLYIHYGAECLHMLNGQFAFAIWDKKKDQLFMARDRVGIKPLFYSFTKGIFSFASEIKSLLQQEYLKPEISPEGIIQVYTFWSTITPDTAFKDIRELSPGNYLLYDRKGLLIKKYWELRLTNEYEDLSVSEAVGRFDELFKDAVSIRLRADVEVAAYLSGGIDSCSTVAYIKDIAPGILNTFSIGFTDKNFDETSYQSEAVEFLGTKHHSINCSVEDIAKYFPAVVQHSETPVMRTAPAPMMMLSELVRENGIKVVITGEGADEILAGYDIFREVMIRKFWSSQPESKIRPLLLKRIYSDIPHLKDANPAILKMFFGYRLGETNHPFYSHMLRWNNSNHVLKTLSDEYRNLSYSPYNDLMEKLPEGFNQSDNLGKAQWLEMNMFMSGYLLSSQGDRMMMANSVEGRYPFLDYRIIEFCSGLPAGYKLKGLNEKYLLKKLINGRIPQRIINRPKKPYRAPVKNVFLSKNAPDYVHEMLSEDYITGIGIFDHKRLSEVLRRIKYTGIASETDNMILSAAVSTHLFYSQFIEHKNNFTRRELKNLKVILDKRDHNTSVNSGSAGMNVQ